MRSHHLAIGDRVRMIGAPESDPEYDTGTIVGFTFDQAKVHWDAADEMYVEEIKSLELVPGAARKAGG